jgi:LmbE family N-acetylglucosaminyl deacetylase
MKIVVFAPHPDDELIAVGGTLLKWIEKGHEIHIIYVSDGRTAYTFERKRGNLIEAKETQITEEELATVRKDEIQTVRKFIGLPKENIYVLDYPSHQLRKYSEKAIKEVKVIIRDADRIVIPSNNNSHTDHQNTYKIATSAAKELNLRDLEFYVYSIYVANRAPKEKRKKIPVLDYRDKVFRALNHYQSQLYLQPVKMLFNHVLRKRYEKFGVYGLKDLGKFYNF